METNGDNRIIPSEVGALEQELEKRLRDSGAYQKCEALLLEEAFKLLHAPLPAPTASRITGLINELIKQYLSGMGYASTCEVFISEAGLTREHIDSGFLSQQFTLTTDPSQLNPDCDKQTAPLLSQLILSQIKSIH